MEPLGCFRPSARQPRGLGTVQLLQLRVWDLSSPVPGSGRAFPALHCHLGGYRASPPARREGQGADGQFRRQRLSLLRGDEKLHRNVQGV